MTRSLLILILAAIPAAAQTPLVRLLNTSRPASQNFQVGDQFEILITAAPKKSVSVRTTRQGRTDWGPVIATTDDTGRWSTTGHFEKSDFGGWSEVWTVGGKLASPAIRFNVSAPCIPGGQSFAAMSGPNMSVMCETAVGKQSFVTPSLSDSFRTPDGRLIPGRARKNMTPEEYHAEILENLIINDGGSRSASERLGDDAAGLITRLIGLNALSEQETRNVITILRAAFQKPEIVDPAVRTPLKTLALLNHLSDMTDQNDLKQEIAETIAYLQAR